MPSRLVFPTGSSTGFDLEGTDRGLYLSRSRGSVVRGVLVDGGSEL